MTFWSRIFSPLQSSLTVRFLTFLILLTGKYCAGNTSFPEPCPAYHYCGNATVNPTPCPNGTYTMDNVSGLSLPEQCTPCPKAVYCQYGQIAGNCLGGFLCYGGSPIPNPTDGVHGIICPFGYFCPPGKWCFSICVAFFW